jgi:hypothetical protein
LRRPTDFTDRLGELRRMYEPFVAARANRFAVPLPPWVREAELPDNWQTSPWERPRAAPFERARGDEEHL